mgnify:CR=1 FL=1
MREAHKSQRELKDGLKKGGNGLTYFKDMVLAKGRECVKLLSQESPG